MSADGSTPFMAARGDNRVLTFDAAALEGPDPAGALLGYVSTGPEGSVGSSPVGVQPFADDEMLLVADSNRYGSPPQGNVVILDVRDPASPRKVGTLASGLFPRNVSIGSDGTRMFLTEYRSNRVQVIRTAVE